MGSFLKCKRPVPVTTSTKTYDLPFDVENDTGSHMLLDRENNRLLIAVKEKDLTEKIKGVYAFDRKKNEY